LDEGFGSEKVRQFMRGYYNSNNANSLHAAYTALPRPNTR